METLEKKKFESLSHDFQKSSKNLKDQHENLKIYTGSQV